MRKITKRQAEIFDFISSTLENYRVAPTFREIAQNFSISIKAAYDHVKALEKKGKLVRDKNKARGLMVPDFQTDVALYTVPVLSSANALNEIFSVHGSDMVKKTKLYLPCFTHDTQYFAIYAGETDVIDTSILCNDLIIVEYQIEYQAKNNNGELVVAHLNDQILLRYYYRDGARAVLRGAKDSAPVYTQRNAILGAVVSIIREFNSNFELNELSSSNGQVLQYAKG